jgi:HK97 gp10 family phage protein
MGFNVSQVEHLAADLAKAPAAMAAGAAVAVTTTAQQIARDAQSMAPVLSGALRASITAKSHGLEGTVSATERYAAYVEYGTSDTAPQPFMRPAADRNEPMLAKALLEVAAKVI